MFSNVDASLLKDLTEAEHIPVPTLGKILSMTLLPRKSDSFFLDKSTELKENSGACEPIFGKFPIVSTGFPPSVIDALFF